MKEQKKKVWTPQMYNFIFHLPKKKGVSISLMYKYRVWVDLLHTCSTSLTSKQANKEQQKSIFFFKEARSHNPNAYIPFSIGTKGCLPPPPAPRTRLLPMLDYLVQMPIIAACMTYMTLPLLMIIFLMNDQILQWKREDNLCRLTFFLICTVPQTPDLNSDQNQLKLEKQLNQRREAYEKEQEWAKRQIERLTKEKMKLEEEEKKLEEAKKRWNIPTPPLGELEDFGGGGGGGVDNKECISTPHQDNSPPCRYWSRWVVFLVGNGPGGELS